MTSAPVTTRDTRMLAPDLARGMMLLFIALANVSAYLWGHEATDATLHPVGEGVVDTWLAAGAILAIDGHVYPMFAFLFGYGITQFSISRINRQIPAELVSRMLLRRHLWMLVFGAVHATLLFAGDILGAYALTGLILAPLLLRGSDRTVKAILWTLGGVAVGIILLGFVSMLALSAFVPSDLLSGNTAAELEIPSSNDLFSGIESWWIAMLVRIGWWLLSSVGAVVSLMVPFMVLLGGLAARYRWLSGVTTRFTLGRVAILGIAIGLVTALPAALGHLGVLSLDPLADMAWIVAAQLGGAAGAMGYVALFGALGQRITRREGLAASIAAVGQRSLSFYLLQSVIFAPLLSAWGLGLGQQLSTAGVFALALGVWLLSLVLATLFERAGKLGPAEMLLRRLTYGNVDRVS